MSIARKVTFWLATFVVLMPTFQIQASEWQVKPYVLLDSFSYSETVSVRDTLNEWKGSEFSKGKRQWSWNWMEVGVRYKNFGLSFVQRMDYDFRFSEGTAELYWLVTNKKNLVQGKHYNASLDVNAFRANGLRFSAQHQGRVGNNSWKLDVGLAYLRANYLIEGSINGTADILSDNDFNYDADADYRYTKDPLFGRSYIGTEGQGFAVDVATEFHFSEGAIWSIQVRDLFSEIYWTSRAFTRAHSSSNRKTYDENGYVSVSPALSGFEGVDEHAVQRLEPRWYTKISHPVINDVNMNLQYRYQYGQSLVGLGAEWQVSQKHQYGLTVWPQSRLLSFSDTVGEWRWLFSVDHVLPRKVNVLWLSLSWQPFK